MYRKDLMEKAGLKMPDAPTWDFISDAADKMTDKAAGINGICLRGKAGWGENMAFLTAISNSFGARWFDEKWNPQFDTPEWKKTLDYLSRHHEGRRPSGRLVQRLQREPRAVPVRQVRHVDRRHRRRLLRRPARTSTVADKVGFALAPDNGLGKRGNWLWAWSLAIPAGTGTRSKPPRSSSPGRPPSTTPSSSPRRMAGPNVPPGTRKSLYANPDYQKAAPFAKMTLDSIDSADPTHPTVKPVPYTGVQFVAIPEFQGIGTEVGQDFSAALAGQMTADDALAKAQATPKRK